MIQSKVILHPTDFSEHSAQAFLLACSLARDSGARLVVCHIAEAPVIAPLGPEVGMVPPAQTDHDFLTIHRKSLEEVKPPRGFEIEIEHRFREGDTVEEILRLAEEIKPEMIVMGTHGRTGMSRLLMGSTAEQIVRRAPCPVLTVKVPRSSD